MEDDGSLNVRMSSEPLPLLYSGVNMIGHSSAAFSDYHGSAVPLPLPHTHLPTTSHSPTAITILFISAPTHIAPTLPSAAKHAISPPTTAFHHLHCHISYWCDDIHVSCSVNVLLAFFSDLYTCTIDLLGECLQ